LNKVLLNDIRLMEYNLGNLSLLKRLKDGLLKTNACVCIERARFITRYLRDMSPSDEPVEIRYANAVNYFLSNKALLFF